MHTRLALLLALVLLLSGCSQLGQHWSNFSAYHNTFYNARLSFEEGVEAVEDPEPAVERGAYLPVFGEIQQASNPEPFEEAIRRSADILRDHPSSRWVDEALLIIGRSYLYLENYVGAEQKFHEVIALGSELTEEAYFWLGRSLLEAEKYEEALSTMEEALEREALPRRWMGRYYIVRGEVMLEQERLTEALDALERGARALPERDLQARAWFLLGQVHEVLRHYEEALAAYEEAEERTFDYELVYEAAIGSFRAAAALGEGQAEALRRLQRMERQQQYEEDRPELIYHAAELYRSMGHTDLAERYYREILSGEEPAPEHVLGRASYALAELYVERDDYLEAAAHYEEAAAALQERSSAAPGMPGDAEQRQRTFGAYASAQEEVLRLDSLLYLSTLNDEELEEVALAMSRDLDESREGAADEPEEHAGEWNAHEEDEQLVDEASETDVSDEEPGSAGFLFHRDPGQVQEGRAAFTRRWGERPLTPNWRRRAAARNLQATTTIPGARRSPAGDDPLAEVDPELVEEAGGEEELPPQADLSAVPRDEEAREEIREQLLEARFDAANALFLQLNEPDSAAVIYEDIVEEHPDHDITVRAHYALAETHRVRGRDEEAGELYRELVERYPDTEFADRARDVLGEPAPEEEAPEVPAVAEGEYRHALERWEAGDLVMALGTMLVLAEEYRQTELAPRALLAAARIFRDWVASESLDPLAPLSTALPDPVLTAAGFDTLAQAPVEEELRLATSASVGGRSEAGPTITDLFERLVERYPDSPQARQARTTLSALEQPESQESEDTELAEAEEQEALQEQDVEDELPGPDTESTTGIDWEEDRWTVVIVSWPEEEHARQSVETFRSRLAGAEVGVDVLAIDDDQGETRYHVGVGQFFTELEAEELLRELEDRLPEEARVVRVPPQ